ncbi:MAG: hypothetical protein IKZ05_03030, partial [Clostridia bacterium]|nr:hypothetical protein [Clostridia bacterium]
TEEVLSQFADKVCKLNRLREMRVVLKKNERRLTKVRQSKFFFKALENTIKISIPYKNTVYFRLMKVHCFFCFAISRA